MSSKTRSTNTNKHPGNPDKKRERRTKVQMEEFRAQEAEKQKQKELDKKAKADRIASVEKKLAEEVDVTPRPAIKQRLRRTYAFQEPEFPLDNNPKDTFPDNSSLTNDDDFQPEPTSSSATERAADKTDDESDSETGLPPKKKTKTTKEPVHVVAVQPSSNAGECRESKGKNPKKNLEASIVVSTLTTKGNQLADEKKLPHGDNVSDGTASERHRAINQVWQANRTKGTVTFFFTSNYLKCDADS
jgi:hypothetical protein